VAGRPAELVGVEQMVGLFINTLPVRVKVRQRAPVAEWLKQLQQEQAEMRQYEHSPLVEVQGWSEMEHCRTLFESIVIFENYPVQSGDAGEGGSLRITDVRYDTRTTYPLMLLVTPGKQMSLEITYDRHRYEEWTIRGMLEHLERLLAGIVDDQMQPISELPMLTDTDWQQLREWNQTRTEYERDLCLHQLFEAQAERTPQAPALIYQQQHLSYHELDSRSTALAHYFQRLGVGPESVVALLLERSVKLVVSLLAVLKAGGAYLPLDVQYPKERLAYMMEDARAMVLVTEERLAGQVSAEGLQVVVLEREWERLTQQSEAEVESRVVESDVVAENLAYVIYTSGSTGRPKGVAIEHRSTVAFLQWSHEVFSKAELAGVLASTSICFDLSVFELFAPLTCGGTVILSENPLQLASLTAAEQVTLINTVPSAMAELLRIRAVPAGVRTINLAGEQLKRELADEVYATTAVERVLNLYGPSEGTTYSTYQEVVRGAKQPPSIGRPIANTKVYILDDDGRIVPRGAVGEMYIGGTGLARGYGQHPDLTAESFLPDPYATECGARLYRTGDLARYLENGELQYLGRSDQQVKLRGYRIELGEIEAVIKEQSWVNQAVVVVAQQPAAEAEHRLMAYVVARQGCEPEAEELSRRLRERLPWYMRPEVVLVAGLPLTVTGKVDRRALAGRVCAGEGRERAEGARSAVEEMLVGIWSEVLGREGVGVGEDFFGMGGHSLQAMQVVSRVRRAFEIELPLEKIFAAPTIAQLATVVVQAQAQQTDDAEVARILTELEGLPSN
jgi:amino acid adenylation domain-containing protein